MTMRRIYRLRKVLEHRGWCAHWRDFIATFETAADVLAAVNAAPSEPVPGDWDARAWSARWAGLMLSARLSLSDDYDWWEARLRRERSAPITPEEADRFRALWVRYADAHGLYEDVPA